MISILMISILIVLTIVFMVFLVLGLTEKYTHTEMFPLGLVFFLLTLVFGWGCIASLQRIHKTDTIISAIVLKEENKAIHLSVDGQIIKTITDIPTYKLLEDKTEVNIKKIQWKSLYGFDVGTEYEYKQ